MRKLFILIILLALPWALRADNIYPTTDVTCIVQTVFRDGNLDAPDSMKIDVYKSGASLFSAWYNSGDPECSASGNLLIFHDQFQDIDGAGGDGQYIIIVSAYDFDSTLYTNYFYNYTVGIIDSAVYAEVSGIDGWNPITDNDSLITDQSSSISLKPTVAGRTLDVTATGEAGIDLSNVAGTLDAAEIGTDAINATKIAADAIGSSEIAAGAVDEFWDELQSGHTTSGTFGYYLNEQVDGIPALNWTYGARQLTALDEDYTTIDLNASTIGSVASGVTVTTNNDKTGYTVSTVSDKTGYKLAPDALDTDTSFTQLQNKVNTNLDVAVSTRSNLTASDNIGINLDDVTGTLDAAEIGALAFTNAKFATACFNANQFQDGTFGAAKFQAGFYGTISDTTHKELIYGSNEDAFKADVSGLSTFDPATDKVTTVDSLAAYISYIANNPDDFKSDPHAEAILTLTYMTLWPGSSARTGYGANYDTLYIYDSLDVNIATVYLRHIGGDAGDPPDSTYSE